MRAGGREERGSLDLRLGVVVVSVCAGGREEREDFAEASRIRRMERRLAERNRRRAEQQAEQASETATP